MILQVDQRFIAATCDYSYPPPIRLAYSFILAQLRCRQNSIAAKWNIFLSFGLKVPFGFPCFAHVCLESWLGLVFFSTAYVTLVVALLFAGLVLLLAFLQGFSIGFCRSVAARSLFSRWERLHVSTNGWTVFLILPLTRDCIFFPGKAHAANSSSGASSLVRMDRS